MNTKLNHIQNWEDLAQQAKWSVSTLAKLCGVSTRKLERHFHERFGKSPRSWLVDIRGHRAVELVGDGFSIKEAANIVGYKYANNFSRKHPGIIDIARSGQ